LFEVQPMVILEAMASAVPVLAPIGGAAEELVTHGRTGLLYRLGDWSTFSDHVKLLSTDRTLAMQMGLRGADRYEAEFSPQVVLAATLGAYDEAIARRKVRRGTS
jgi:glycosyltransferase involved in cell wall biosynthesis